MPSLIRFITPAVLAVIAPFAVSMLVPGTVRAADCIAAPNGAAPAGSHWYYRTDRATRRKCWYVAAEDRGVRHAVRRPAPQAEPPSAEPPSAEPPALSLAPPTVARQVLAPRVPAPRVLPPAAKTAPDRATAPDEPSETDVWPAIASADATSGEALSRIDPAQSAAAGDGGSATSASVTPEIAAPVSATTGASTDVTDASRDVWPVPPAQEIAADETVAEADAETALMMTPMRMLILLLCALAVLGAVVYEIFQIAARRRQAELDQSIDRNARQYGRRPPRFDDTPAPWPPARGRLDQPPPNEPTSRGTLRDEGRPMWGEPAA